jgi:hypothetical protein
MVRRHLWVVDPDGRIPDEFLVRVGRLFDLMLSGPGTEPRCPFRPGECEGVVIVSNGKPKRALELAREIKASHREAVVVLMGVPRRHDILYDASRAGVEAVVDSGDLDTLYKAVISRIPPVEVAL